MVLMSHSPYLPATSYQLPATLVRRLVDEIVHAETVGVVGGRVAIEPFRGPFPVVADVVVPVGDGQHAARRVVVLEQTEEHGFDTGKHRMRNVERLEAVERLEDRMPHVKADEVVVRQ